MASLSTWCRYIAHKFEYSLSLSYKVPRSLNPFFFSFLLLHKIDAIWRVCVCGFSHLCLFWWFCALYLVSQFWFARVKAANFARKISFCLMGFFLHWSWCGVYRKWDVSMPFSRVIRYAFFWRLSFICSMSFTCENIVCMGMFEGTILCWRNSIVDVVLQNCAWFLL